MEPVPLTSAGRTPRSRWSWSRRTNLQKFEDYTAWSLYLLAMVLPLVMVQWHSALVTADSPLLNVFWVLVVAETAAGIWVVHEAIVAMRESRAARRTPAVVLLSVAAAALVCGAVQLRYISTDPRQATLWIPVAVIGFAIGVSSTTFTKSALLWLAAGGLVAGIAAWWWMELGADRLAARAISVVIFILLGSLSMRASMTMLRFAHELDRARSVEAKLAVAEERLRFGRDLHDTLGHNLSAIALKSQLAAQLTTRSADAATSEIGEIRRIAEGSLTQMRAVVQGFQEIDLATELRGAQSLLRSASIEVGLQLDPAAIPMKLHEPVAWVVREAVTNIIRHSDARSCTIEHSAVGDDLIIRVTNDRPRARSEAGTGLPGLQQRLSAVGGIVGSHWSAEQFELVATFPHEGASSQQPTGQEEDA